jgi:transposase
MDRALLQALLAEGLSLAEIGRRMGRHESTVSYWLGKHGLRAAHDSRGRKEPLARDRLAALVEAGHSAARIAEELDRSPTTVVRWLREYGLQTQWTARRHAIAAAERRLVLRCARHGIGEFSRMTGGGFRCTRCRSEAVSRRRRRLKQLLVEEAGGKCVRCVYDRCVAALEFHHVDPREKRFTLSGRGVARSLARARAEAAKCVLLCSNCHAEVEAGVAQPG